MHKRTLADHLVLCQLAAEGLVGLRRLQRRRRSAIAVPSDRMKMFGEK